MLTLVIFVLLVDASNVKISVDKHLHTKKIVERPEYTVTTTPGQGVCIKNDRETKCYGMESDHSD